MRALIVTHAFGEYSVGEQIIDPKTIDELKQSHSVGNFVQVELPDLKPVANAKSA